MTQIQPDPDVVIGQLDNGLTYYVRSNDRPGGTLELRLVVRAGSLHEEVAGSGIAHFTEHMLFNGTAAYPGNSLNEALRELGTEFGPDLNAYTSHDETVFELSLPSTDDATITAGFAILDEWAERALIEDADTVEERGVIREEFRLRAESFDGVVFESFDGLYTAASAYSGRTPIGTETSIESTTAAQVRAFYDRWYRPDLMAIVAVGDVDTRRLETEIIERFSDNAPRVEGPADPVESAAGLLSEPHVEVIANPDAPEAYVSLDVSLPLRSRGTVEGERLLLRDDVVAALIQQRLDDLVAQGGSEVLRPFAGNFDYTRARRFLGFNFAADDEALGLAEVLGELQAIATQGFGEGELERVIADLRSGVDQLLAGAGSRQDRYFADSYVEHFLVGQVIDSAADAHARLVGELDALDAAAVSAHFAEVWGASAPLVIVVGPDRASLPTEDDLWAAIATGQGVTESVVAARGDATLPEAAAPVKEVDRTAHDDLSAVELRFANGVRVLFRYSDVDQGRVDLWAESLGGWSLLDVGEGALVGTVTNAVGLSGVGDLDAVDLDIALAGADVSVTPYIGATEEGLVGSGTAEDLDLLLQLLALRLTAPRVDPGALAEAVEASRTQLRQVGSDPTFASYVDLLDARTGGDPWYRLLPTLDELEVLTAADALALYRGRFGAVDDLVVVIVGDVDAADVAAMARQHLGTLRAGGADGWIDHLPPAPAGVTSRSMGAGPNDSGAGFDMLMVTDVSLSESQRQALRVLENLLNNRLVEQVREQLGASYGGGQVFIEVSTRPRELVDVVLSVSGDPARVEELHEVVLAVVADLADDGPSSEEFEQARRVVQSDLDTYGNWDLLVELMDRARLGADAPTLTGSYAALIGLERGDVAAAARLVLHLDDRIEVFRRP